MPPIPGCSGHSANFAAGPTNGYYNFTTGTFQAGPGAGFVPVSQSDFVVHDTDQGRWIVIPQADVIDTFVPCELTTFVDPDGIDWLATVQNANNLGAIYLS